MKTGNVTESAKHQLVQLQEVGLLYDDILNEIAKYTDATEQHVKALFEDAGVESVEFDNLIYTSNNLIGLDIRQSPAMLQTLNAGYRKTLGNLKNLTLTTANTSQTLYYNATNQAYMQVASGAFSYQEAIRNAIKQVAKEGAFIMYPSGHRDRVDVAVRRAVLTGVGQTCREIGLIHAEEMGCDLMELSAHSGARPSHALWQGKIVSLSGRDGYLSKSNIGYGTGDGFGGWNCRHDWFPFFENVSTRNYTDKQLKELDEKNIEYNGNMYSEYDITQMMRAKERQIRATRRELTALDTAMKTDLTLKDTLYSDFTSASVKLKNLELDYKDFCRSTGQFTDNFRLQSVGFNKSVSQKAVWANKKSVSSVDNSPKKRYNIYRKTKNIGEFAELLEPMQKRHVKKIIEDMGIDFSNIEIDIIRDNELIGKGLYGFTFSNGKRIQIYPDAFSDREQLVKTIGHERIHCEQIKLFGEAQNSEESIYYEKGPTMSEEYWWTDYIERTGYDENN